MINETISVLATIMGVLMATSGLPQIYRIFKRKSSADISLVMISIFIAGNGVWTVYGVLFNNYPLIITNVVGLAAWSLTAAVVMRFKK